MTPPGEQIKVCDTKVIYCVSLKKLIMRFCRRRFEKISPKNEQKYSQGRTDSHQLTDKSAELQIYKILIGWIMVPLTHDRCVNNIRANIIMSMAKKVTMKSITAKCGFCESEVKYPLYTKHKCWRDSHEVRHLTIRL